MRTGPASVGMGLALHAIFGKSDEALLAKATACFFILLGITIFVQAFLAARRLLKRLGAHSAEPVSQTRMAVTAGLFAGGSTMLAILLWWL